MGCTSLGLAPCIQMDTMFNADWVSRCCMLKRSTFLHSFTLFACVQLLYYGTV